MDFKDSMDNWKNSPKFKAFQKEKAVMKRFYVNKTWTFNELYMFLNEGKNLLSESDILHRSGEILEFFKLPNNEKELIENREGYDIAFLMGEPEELLEDYKFHSTSWHFYMKLFVTRENYEMAAICLSITKLNYLEFKRKVETYILNPTHQYWLFKKTQEADEQLTKTFKLKW